MLSDEFIKLINDYDIIIEKMTLTAEEAQQYRSKPDTLVAARVASMLEMKLKAALITLKIP